MKNVVIIGAGPAGLTAAYTLLNESSEYHPIIIEASEFIGGISRTARYNGNRIDIGGHRFFSKNKEVMKLWMDILPLQGAPSKDDKVLGRTHTFRRPGDRPGQNRQRFPCAYPLVPDILPQALLRLPHLAETCDFYQHGIRQHDEGGLRISRQRYPQAPGDLA